MAIGGWTPRQRSYYQAWATSVTARTVGLSAYTGMQKPGFTYSRNGNLAETKLAETETGQKVCISSQLSASVALPMALYKYVYDKSF